jgi:hypothetical protein
VFPFLFFGLRNFFGLFRGDPLDSLATEVFSEAAQRVEEILLS